MAATITNIGSGFDTDTGGDILDTGATITGTTANNDWFVVVAAAGNLSSASSFDTATCTDSAGNTYTRRQTVFWSPGGTGGDGASLGIYTAPVTSNITNGTVTITFTTNPDQKALTVYRFRPGAGETASYVASGSGTGANQTGHSAGTVSVTIAHTIFGAASIETNDAVTGDSDTTNGSWSAIATVLAEGPALTDTGSMTVSSQYKTVSSTANQTWTCTTTSARDSISGYVILRVNAAAKTLAAAAGSYLLSPGSDVSFRKGRKVIPDAAGSYALTGTAATFIYSGLTKTIAAGVGAYSLLGTDTTLTHGYKLDATTAGSYALTGTSATLRRALPMVADLGTYVLTGTDVTLTKASLTNKVLTVDAGSYNLLGTNVTLTLAHKLDATTAGSYALTGSAAALVTAANKVLLAEPGSYALTGTDATLTAGVAPPSVSPLHIGEWPIDKKKRRRREDAVAAEQRARKRFRDAIGRLLEGLPPEFDEPADLDEALDSAVQAANLLYAMSAPIREINAVNELIDHIRQLRIAQPIAQLAMAQAYNQAHRHLKAKAQEDAVMTLLLGE